jgi:3',5'-cyclic AMP phosphodiesterase CpdA
MREKLIFLLTAAAVLLLCFLFLRPQADALPPLGEMRIALATDMHYLAPELTDNGAYFQKLLDGADGKITQHSDALMELFLQAAEAERPDAVVLTGDLSFNGEKRSHEALAEKLRTLRAAGIAVYVLPGNHDLENPMAAHFQGDGFSLTESVTPAEFAEIYAEFGYADALARDENSLSYTAQLGPGLRLLAVDVNTPDSPGALTDATLSWVRRQLIQARQAGQRVISATHQNLLAHNALFQTGYTFENADALRTLLADYLATIQPGDHTRLRFDFPR